MNGLTVDHEMFRQLRLEHREILEKLNSITNRDVCKEDILWLWENGEMHHHQREEKILFNFLLEEGQCDGGGPLCMLYMDQYILEPPLERATALTGKTPEIEEHQLEIFDRGSAMRIPVNEHRAGKELLRHLLENWETLETSHVKSCLKEYQNLQTVNIQKEENCFYFMCATLLRPEQANRLLEELRKQS
jgi:hemerythrin-like domain-containing protein